MNSSLRPMLTMREIYGGGRVYAPRAHRQTCGWITRDAALLDMLTGNQLCIAGAMPVVCSTGTTTPAGLELLAEAGLETAVSKEIFRNEQQAIELACDLARQGNKLVVQHAYPPGVIPPDRMWIDPRFLSYLNNKANLVELAPAAHVPARTVSSWSAFRNSPPPALPVVLKVATNDSTGAGASVAICRTDKDLDAAAERFAAVTHIVVESFLPIVQNLCVNFAVLPDGSTHYLGYAEQHVTETGQYKGNWIELGSTLPPTVLDVGLAVVQRGAMLGYRGVAGMDIAILDDGQVMVMDLNFRLNGSTAAVLLAPAIVNAKGPAMMHLRSFVARNGFAAMVATARAAVRRGRLLPLCLFDAPTAGHPNQPCRLSGLVLGESKSDILAAENEFASDGLA